MDQRPKCNTLNYKILRRKHRATVSQPDVTIFLQLTMFPLSACFSLSPHWNTCARGRVCWSKVGPCAYSYNYGCLCSHLWLFSDATQVGIFSLVVPPQIQCCAGVWSEWGWSIGLAWAQVHGGATRGNVPACRADLSLPCLRGKPGHLHSS